MLGWILGFSLLGGAGSVVGACVLWLFPQTTRKVLVPALISYATGTLLAAALIGLIPEAAEHKPLSLVLSAVLFGIILFFLLEKVVLWRHCHEGECDVHSAAGSLILIGDSFHNFVDGVVIAAAFMQSFDLGIAAGLAVIAHEVTQEVGDFAILLNSGYSFRKALVYNLISSLANIPGALIAYFALSRILNWIPYILAVSASSFLYIALSDLVPGLHKEATLKASAVQILLVGLGIATVWLLHLWIHAH